MSLRSVRELFFRWGGTKKGSFGERRFVDRNLKGGGYELIEREEFGFDGKVALEILP